MLTWPVVIALALGVYLQRAAGALLLRAERLPDSARSVLDALPVATIAGVVALTTLTDDGSFSIDARLAGVAVAGLCAWRKVPMLGAVIAAALTTALIRALL